MAILIILHLPIHPSCAGSCWTKPAHGNNRYWTDEGQEIISVTTTGIG
jgi:hypothetical protein